MNKMSDETIMAYIDGELGETERAEVERAMEADPSVRQRASIFQESRQMLQGLYDEPLKEEVPDRFKSVIFQDEDAEGAAGILDRLRGYFLGMPLGPVAACLVVFVCAAAAYHLFRATWTYRDEIPFVLAGKDVQRILDTVPSGETASLEGHALDIMPVLTFEDERGRYCRRFDVFRTAEGKGPGRIPAAQGLVCRDSEGRWKLLAYVAADSKGTSGSNREGSYSLATGKGLLDALTASTMARGPLSEEEELELIEGHWRGQ